MAWTISFNVSGSVHINKDATSGQIFQLEGSQLMAITGIAVGSSGTFQVVWNGAMSPTSSDVWSANDPGVSLSPNTTDPTIVVAAVVSTDTNTSFMLTVTGTNSVNSTVTATASVPIIQPPPAPATGGTINQLS